MLGPDGHSAHTGEVPMTGPRLEVILWRVGVLTEQFRGKGPGVGTVGVAVGKTVTTLVGDLVPTCTAFGFSDETQLASKSRKITRNTEDEGMCINIVLGMPSFSLHLSNLITSSGTALQL
jgi:hypothetical protein